MARKLSTNSRIFYTILYVVASALYLLYSAIIKGAADLDDFFFNSATAISLFLLAAGLFGYYKKYSLQFYRLSAGILATSASIHYLYYYMQSGFQSLMTPGYFIIYFYCSLFFWRNWQHVFFAFVFLTITTVESTLYFEDGRDAFLFTLLHGLGSLSISSIFVYQLWLRQQSKQGFGTLKSFLEFNNDPIFTYSESNLELLSTNPAAAKLLEATASGQFLSDKEELLNKLQQRVALFVHSRTNNQQVVLSEQEQLNVCGKWYRSNLYYFKSAYRPTVLLALKDITQEINLVGALKASDINQEFYEYLIQISKHNISIEEFLTESFRRWKYYLPGVYFVKVMVEADKLNLVHGEEILLIETTLPSNMDISKAINFGQQGGIFQSWLQINLLKDGLWLPLGYNSQGLVGIFALVPKIEVDHALPVELVQSMSIRFFSVLGQVLHKLEQDQRHQYQQKILAAFPDLVILLDKRGYYLEVAGGRDQDIYMSKTEHVGKHIREILPIHVVLLMEDAIYNSIKTGLVQTINYELVVNGDQNFFETTLTPIDDDKVLLVSQNNTEQIRIEGLLKSESHVLSLLNEDAELEVSILRLLKGLESTAGDLYATFVFLDDSGKAISRCLSASLPPEFSNSMVGLAIGPKVGTCGSAMFLKKKVITEDILKDPKWKDSLDIVKKYELRSCTSQPIISKEGKVYGSLALYKKIPYRPSANLSLFIERASAFIVLLYSLKESRRELRKSEQFYKGIIENNIDLIMQYSIHGEILLVNKAFGELFGISPVNFIGKSIFEIAPPEQHPSIKEVMDRVVHAKEKVDDIKEVLTPDLQMHVVEWANYPVLNEQGEVIAVQVVGRDITALKLAEQRIFRNEQLLKSINANIQDGIYRSEIKSGKLLYANKAFLSLFQYEKIEDIPNQSVSNLYAQPEERIQMLNDPQPGMSIKNKEVKLINSKGQEFWGMYSCVVSNDENNVLFYDGVIKDITEIRKADEKILKQNAALKKLNSEMDRFVYSVSHNLRAPLTSILGLINILKLEPQSIDQISSMMQVSVAKLDNFIKDLIDYLKNSRLELNPERIDLRMLIEEIYESHRFIHSSEKLSFINQVPSGETIDTDSPRFRLIMENILSNAFKYYNPQKESSEIRVSSKKIKNDIIIEISDNGMGIESQHLNRIFDMFYRANDKTQGSGLGLFIVKEAVERLGGTIEVESEINVGTKFILQIPNLSKNKAAELNRAFTNTLI